MMGIQRRMIVRTDYLRRFSAIAVAFPASGRVLCAIILDELCVSSRQL